MRVTLQNIGQVKNAEIDLNKDLIIFCGGNNTGKTYTAYSIYGLLKFADTFADSHGLAEVTDKLGDLFNVGAIELDIHDILSKKLYAMLDAFGASYKEHLPTVFASSDDFFKDSFVKVQIDIDKSMSTFFPAEVSKKLRFGKNIGVDFIKKTDSYMLNIVLSKEGEKQDFPTELILQIVNSTVVAIICEFLFNNTHIAPAERVATNIFSRELSEKRNGLIDRLLMHENSKTKEVLEFTDFLEKRTSRYSLPIKDSLEFSEKLDVLQKQKGNFWSLGEQIEKAILKGKMKVSKTGEVLFSPEKTELSLGIHLTASVVKSLANVVFYCKYIAKPNDLLIIDEPELNLHPDNQRQMARVIAQMVNAGIKVMISTHSDYIIRELNNLMMLNTKGADKEVTKLMKKYGYKKEHLLDYNKVGAYLFTTDVKALEVGATGFEVKTIDDEINQLNEASEEIYLTLHDN